MLGLKRGTVKLVQHNPRWKKFFEEEKQRLKEEFRNWVLNYDIEVRHIGSTAVRRIVAKPIIDILIGVRTAEDIHWTQEPLEKLGYTLIPHACDEDKLFFALGNNTRRTHHVHITQYQGTRWRNDVLFVDYLKSHPERAKEYNDLKKELSKRYPDNRKEYTNGKAEFIEKTLKLAGIKVTNLNSDPRAASRF